MPIYEYQCESCHQVTEAIQRMDDPPLQICPHCGGPLRKRLSAPTFQFKGTGWYATDYAGKKGDRADPPSAGAKSEPDGGSSSDSGAAAKEGGASAKSDDTTSTPSS